MLPPPHTCDPPLGKHSHMWCHQTLDLEMALLNALVDNWRPVGEVGALYIRGGGWLAASHTAACSSQRYASQQEVHWVPSHSSGLAFIVWKKIKQCCMVYCIITHFPNIQTLVSHPLWLTTTLSTFHVMVDKENPLQIEMQGRFIDTPNNIFFSSE